MDKKNSYLALTAIGGTLMEQQVTDKILDSTDNCNTKKVFNMYKNEVQYEKWYNGA